MKTNMLLGVLATILSLSLTAQEKKAEIPDSVLSAAREIITSNNFCALVTLDNTGQPQVRTMNPFPLGEEFEIWFATSRNSRKVTEIINDGRVCVYYADHSTAKGYVTLTGTATVIDDKELLLKKKREYWENIPQWQDVMVLIKIVPETLDVVNYNLRLYGDPETWRATSVRF
jgi:general stress protein 26